MIVTCPSCTARYKIDEAKIQGRGAKITCPTCKHKFVVYRDGDEQQPAAAPAKEAPKPPPDLARRDFRQLGLVWKVRKSIGITYDVNDLVALRELIAEGQVDKKDALSYDAREWRTIGEITNLEAYFWEIWQKAEKGEIQRPEADESDEEDASDAPTTIVGHGTSLADEIRKAVHEARTPAPVQERSTKPAPQPTASANAVPEPPPVVAPAPVAPPVAPAAPAPAPAAPAPTASGGGNGAMIAVGVVIALVVLVGVLWAAGVFGGAS